MSTEHMPVEKNIIEELAHSLRDILSRFKSCINYGPNPNGMIDGDEKAIKAAEELLKKSTK